MNKLIQILWKIFLLTFPFSLHFVVYEKATYRFGNFNPWVTGFLFLPELLLIAVFLLRLIFQSKIKNEKLSVFRKEFFLFIFFLINTGVVTFFYGDMKLFLFFVFHIFSGVAFYGLMKAEIIPLRHTIRWLLFGALFQILLAFFQVLLNHSVGLSLIGEPHISPAILNVAKNELANGTKAIRGYGTFLHPNILGAYLMTVLFVSLPFLKRFSLFFWTVILLAGIYLTGSRAALLTTGVLLFLFLFFKVFKTIYVKKVVCFGLLTLFFVANIWFFLNSQTVKVDNPSFAERLEQNVISREMAKDNLGGVGANQFTLHMEEYSANKLKPWSFQPVHNVYFLVLNELGVQGLFIFLLMIILVLKASLKEDENSENPLIFLSFLGLIFIASFDHLLWTSYIGLLLIGLVLSRINSQKSY